MDKEEFLNDINSIPYWVRNGDDLLKFCKHIQYRLLQSKNENHWYQSKCVLSDEECLEISVISAEYDETYENDHSQPKPFKDPFGMDKKAKA